jgi:hypothetical protein
MMKGSQQIPSEVAEHYQVFSDYSVMQIKLYRGLTGVAWAVTIISIFFAGGSQVYSQFLKASLQQQNKQTNDCRWELLNTPAPQAAHRCKQILNNSK